MPTSNPPEVVEVATREPVPVVAPMVLGVTVPMLASPEVIFIPHKMPLIVVAPLLVVIVIAAIVLPWILFIVPPAVKVPLMPIYLSATVEFRVIVPVAEALAYPITFPEIVYPFPDVTVIHTGCIEYIKNIIG
jgi:hypothetical protein